MSWQYALMWGFIGLAAISFAIALAEAGWARFRRNNRR